MAPRLTRSGDHIVMMCAGQWACDDSERLALDLTHLLYAQRSISRKAWVQRLPDRQRRHVRDALATASRLEWITLSGNTITEGNCPLPYYEHTDIEIP